MRHSLFAFLLFAAVGLKAQAPPPRPADPPPAADPGAGGVSLMPNRVILEGKDRSAEVMLKNSGSTRASFRISVVEKAMTEEGKLAERTREPGETTAADLIRFTPRQVDLEPGGSQIVRIQLRKPEQLPDGEYRSHMLFQGIPPAKPATPVTGEDTERRLSFSITQVMGITIPIIVRHGKTQASISLTEPTYYQPTHAGAVPVVSCWLERTGNRSVIGDVTATLESGGTLPKGTTLWSVKSVGIYTNLSRRKVLVGLPDAVGGKLKGAKVRLTYQSTDMKAAPASTTVDLSF